MVKLNGEEMNRRLEELLKKTAVTKITTAVNVPTPQITLVTGGATT